MYRVCAVGTYVTSNGTATSDRTCSLCPSGSTCAGGFSLPVPNPSAAYLSPPGAPAPIPVGAGNYSTPLNASINARTGQAVCPIGDSCVSGAIVPCVDGSTFQSQPGQSTCAQCANCTGGFTVLKPCNATANTVCAGLNFLSRYLLVDIFSFQIPRRQLSLSLATPPSTSKLRIQSSWIPVTMQRMLLTAS